MRTDLVARFLRAMCQCLLILFCNLTGASDCQLHAFDQILVSHRGAGNVMRYSSDGTFLGSFGGPELIGANGMALGPSGTLFVADEVLDRVVEYDALSGDYLGVFASGGGLSFPVGIAFGPDGDLYVSSCNTDSVKRYDGESGAYVGNFASNFNLNCPIQPAFGPHGDLYVTGVFSNNVTRFDGATGQFKEVFASGNGITRAVALEFGPDGYLYVGSQSTSEIKRFDAETGEFIDDFITEPPSEPGRILEQLHFSPDGDIIYLSDHGTGEIRRYDESTGQFLNVFVTTPQVDGDTLRDFVFLSVPEPNALALFLLGSLTITLGRRG